MLAAYCRANVQLHRHAPQANDPLSVTKRRSDAMWSGTSSNENKMSDGGRGRASLGVEVWKSSQKWSVQRSAVRSIAWLDVNGTFIATNHSTLFSSAANNTGRTRRKATKRRTIKQPPMIHGNGDSSFLAALSASTPFAGSRTGPSRYRVYVTAKSHTDMQSMAVTTAVIRGPDNSAYVLGCLYGEA